MPDELIVLLAEREVGRLRQKHGRTSFTYLDGWRNAPGAYPLSLSIPLVKSSHPPDSVEPWLWNLLPDNETTLTRLGHQFGLSARNIFGLLGHVGEDLAGAVQIVRPDRVAELTTPGPEEVEWLTEEGVEELLKKVREDASSTRLSRTAGQFSLAGTQPKTALFFREGRWGQPRGRTPTTHILKPPTGDWDAFAENEHFCLTLARRLGLPVAASSVQRFGEETAIVVERYDRVELEGRFVRVHQEDCCQALGVRPTSKYENEGGPGVVGIVNLLRERSSFPEEDVQTFLETLALNWLLGGTDAHGKNFSLLLGGNGQIRLAPLYDLASALPYYESTLEIRLAMRIGTDYVVGRIHPHQWEQLATALDLSSTEVWGWALETAEALPEALRETLEDIHREKLDHQVLDRLVGQAAVRAKREAEVLRGALGRSTT